MHNFDVYQNQLNDFFLRIGKFQPYKIFLGHTTNGDLPSLPKIKFIFLSPTSPDEIILLSKTLNKNAALGFDMIPMKALLHSINAIAPVLSNSQFFFLNSFISKLNENCLYNSNF